MLQHPAVEELLLVSVDVLLVRKPRVRPEVDLCVVNAVVSHVGGEVLASNPSPSIAWVVLHTLVVLPPVALVPNGDQVVGVNSLGVVGHDLHPALQKHKAVG